MIARLVVALLLTNGVAWAQHPDDVFVGQKAPELKDGDAWINSAPLKLVQLRGKVVLIDFWAWDCRLGAAAMTHSKDLYAKYGDDRLAPIAVHVPHTDHKPDV